MRGLNADVPGSTACMVSGGGGEVSMSGIPTWYFD